ncbi:Transglutaminase-like enzymes, putative cysteine proteases [Paenibacillus uliginis N3/975]|uniref:Transglutaminase-like enzymes, putative cysteine proteases n=1 Tax=Paenibacillus uliginis N3/975 TaxID=1313296 RepID=A0A1X7GLT9_9BACL|nr:transglutaminase domain-containing protein [Paenibacillus uliginis]SMF71606.1 Transglutaminase-like enzymes, putative cysteine proteases [Paenibacillus uliginis N3/975]
MLSAWSDSVREGNGITILLLFIVAFSLIQGWTRGASRSAGKLAFFLGDALLRLISIGISVPFTLWLSPKASAWLESLGSQIPDRELKLWEQIYYTFVKSMADFALLRFAVLFMISYCLIVFILRLLVSLTIGGSLGLFGLKKDKPSTIASRLAGAGIGAVMGVARGIVVIAILFIWVSLYPDHSFSRYVESSPVYQDGAQAVMEPLSGSLVRDKLPVFTQSVQEELNGIMQQKYEVIDHSIPEGIEQTAAHVVKGTATDEEKARKLYDWVGTRVSYDYDKVKAYEEQRIWHEQTPQDTYDTRSGVCIDYARLYSMMARSQDMKVRVVTGRGYNGQGGYGPHAWNEVYLSEKQQWIPLDPTWAQSGNWFNPPRFNETHIKEQVF